MKLDLHQRSYVQKLTAQLLWRVPPFLDKVKKDPSTDIFLCIFDKFFKKPILQNTSGGLLMQFTIHHVAWISIFILPFNRLSILLYSTAYLRLTNTMSHFKKKKKKKTFYFKRFLQKIYAKSYSSVPNYSVKGEPNYFGGRGGQEFLNKLEGQNKLMSLAP